MKRAGSIKNDCSMLRRHILPKLGRCKVHEVRSRDLGALHTSLRGTRYQANRTLALISKMFSLAARWDLRADNPATGIEKFAEGKRTRWLSDAELATLMTALDAHPKQFWQSVTKAADLEDYRIHDNRHTHASHLVSSGMSLPIVGRLLRHTNPTTTQRYAHLADDPLRRAAEIMGDKIVRRKRG